MRIYKCNHQNPYKPAMQLACLTILSQQIQLFDTLDQVSATKFREECRINQIKEGKQARKRQFQMLNGIETAKTQRQAHQALVIRLLSGEA